MSTINAMRLRQKAQRLELPDKPVSTTVLQSVDAACNKYPEKRGMMYKWTSSYSGKRVKKELGAILTRGEAADRCAETGTLPTRSDSDGQSVSMIVR
jgi:hypothetical protein